MNILLPVDGSAYTKKALQYIEGHPDLFGKSHQYTVLHVGFALPSNAASHISSAVLRELHDEEAKAATGEARATLERLGLPFQIVSVLGDPGPTIARYAREKNSDLILLGTHGHGGFRGLVLGSVAQRVVAECTVPVLLIR